ncbi:MAG: hypothetical protein H0W72_14110 [Planctomycetes bacterium]|nr:hypothetical protein [Planctomycetota bacterium]
MYATLQQVQRRITEQTTPEDAAPPIYPFNQPTPLPDSLVVPLQGMTSAAPADPVSRNPLSITANLTRPATSTAPSVPHSVATPRRALLQLSGELASVLFLLWLATVVIGFFAGKYYGERHATSASGTAGFADGPAGSREPRGNASMPAEAPAIGNTAAPAAPIPKASAGQYILVLQSVARVTAEDEQRFRADADKLNAYAERRAKDGLKPWFGIRRPVNGGLQLVFGQGRDGVSGVDKEQFQSFADSLGRAGYKDVKWLKL